MLDQKKVLKSFEENVEKGTPKYKTCIGIMQNLKGYMVVDGVVYFYLGGEKRMGYVTYEDVNKMLLDAISEKGNKDAKYNVPEMNRNCQIV